MPARPQRAIVHDVSRHGCRIEVPGGPIELGGTAQIEVPGTANISGQVVWTKGRVAGVRFERALGGAAAVALGLEQPAPVEAAPEIDFAEPAGGILRHWFRRLTGCFS
jgi:hypothetical protein